jgi:translation initiation factor 1
MSERARPVYSTDKGELCPTCGWPVRQCVCSSTRGTETVTGRIVARLRIEKSGRGGKTVTVVDGLPNNTEFVKALASELKQLCGTGGAAKEGAVELQGDHRERLRPYLIKKTFTVKG